MNSSGELVNIFVIENEIKDYKANHRCDSSSFISISSSSSATYSPASIRKSTILQFPPQAPLDENESNSQVLSEQLINYHLSLSSSVTFSNQIQHPLTGKQIKEILKQHFQKISEITEVIYLLRNICFQGIQYSLYIVNYGIFRLLVSLLVFFYNHLLLHRQLFSSTDNSILSSHLPLNSRNSDIISTSHRSVPFCSNADKTNAFSYELAYTPPANSNCYLTKMQRYSLENNINNNSTQFSFFLSSILFPATKGRITGVDYIKLVQAESTLVFHILEVIHSILTMMKKSDKNKENNNLQLVQSELPESHPSVSSLSSSSTINNSPFPSSLSNTNKVGREETIFRNLLQELTDLNGLETIIDMSNDPVIKLADGAVVFLDQLKNDLTSGNLEHLNNDIENSNDSSATTLIHDTTTKQTLDFLFSIIPEQSDDKQINSYHIPDNSYHSNVQHQCNDDTNNQSSPLLIPSTNITEEQ